MERIKVYVGFTFGSFAYIGVNKKDGETLQDAVRNDSRDIDGYIDPTTNKYIKL